jgi:hypothetical protein
MTASGGEAAAWGLEGHRIVTVEAARRLPPDLAEFFAGESAALVELSLVPDTRLRQDDPAERPRHYINVEEYDEPPFEQIPREREKAEARYGKQAMDRSGTLPWRILDVFRDLRSAMRNGKSDAIVQSAGYLAHYVADLFQPLHTTSNFDGRATCNHGIHEAFESEMISRRAGEYRRAVERGASSVTELRHPAESLFDWMRESRRLVNELLAADTAAIKALKSARRDYYDSMDLKAGPIAERQMSAAANALASLWYTAWIDAGRPELPRPAATAPR